MPFVQGKCPNCGGFLAVDKDADAAVCQFCDTPFIVEKAINNYNISVSGDISINGVDTINVVNQKDFVIEAGVLKEYHGESMDVVIPDNVIEIGPKAFSFGNIRSVRIPNSVKRFGENGIYVGFRCCEYLEHIELSSGLDEIPPEAFEGCKSLSSIKIPTGVKTISFLAFKDCSALKEIEIPESVTKIEDEAFKYCTSLITVKTPSKIEKIEESTFEGCQSISSVVIPDSVTCIGRSAFKECTKLKAIIIGEKVKIIEDEAFNDCKNLSSIDLRNVTELKGHPFSGCCNLTQIKYDRVDENHEPFRGTPFLDNLIKDRIDRGVCIYCGGTLKGLFTKTCTVCKRRDVDGQA